MGYERIETGGERIYAWYPTPANGETLRFADYLGDEARDLSTFLAGTGVPAPVIDSLFDGHLFAGGGRSPLEGPFPLVLVAQGNGESVIDQVVLCEYLASQGYVVATTPSPTRETPLEREDQVGEFAERQADDLAAAIGVLAASLPVNGDDVALVGHSFGARSALLLAMRDPRIRALVSLDGGIGTSTAEDAFRTAPSFDPEARLPPILHFYEELDGFMTPDFSLLESLRTETLTLVSTTAMHHVHFTTYGFAAAAFPAIEEVTHASPKTAKSVRDVARRTAAFLATHLDVAKTRAGP